MTGLEGAVSVDDAIVEVKESTSCVQGSSWNKFAPSGANTTGYNETFEFHERKAFKEKL